MCEIKANPHPAPATVYAWDAKLTLLCAEEPPQMRALDAICFNQTLDSFFSDEAQRRRLRRKVTWVQRLFCQLIAFHNSNFGPAHPDLPRTPLAQIRTNGASASETAPWPATTEAK